MLTLTSPRPGRVPRWVVLALFALLATVSLVVWSADAARAAQVPPRPDSGAVLDQADILSDADEQRLNDQIGRLNGENDHVRVAILTVDGVDGDFEDFTRQTATEWGVGDAGKNNGVLIAADMDERELRIEVGERMEVLARYRDAVVAVRQGNILGISFRPELTGDTTVHEELLGLVRTRRSVEASAA